LRTGRFGSGIQTDKVEEAPLQIAYSIMATDAHRQELKNLAQNFHKFDRRPIRGPMARHD
jgi:hypothetical protein